MQQSRTRDRRVAERGVEAIDTTVQKTNIWLKEIMEELHTPDKHKAYLALRAVLHSLRDRLSIGEATDLGAQLPMLIRGMYYDSWQPAAKPVKFDKGEFFANVRQQFAREPVVDAERITAAVLRIIDRHIADGEIEDIKGALPADLREFWDVCVSAGAAA